MLNMKSISCIIPVYGLEDKQSLSYFEDLLSSVKESAKSLKECFELIIVNDDKLRISEETIKNCCLRQGVVDKLIYLENDGNKGQAYSRNKGARNAHNEFLHFIDQDDKISSNFYDEFLSTNKRAQVYIATPRFLTGKKSSLALTKLSIFYYKFCSSLKSLWLLLSSNLVYSPGQVIIARSIFNKVNGFPVLNNRGADDFAFFYELTFKHNAKYTFLEKSIFYYRIHQFQNSRLSGTNLSVSEYLDSKHPFSIREKIVKQLKIDSKLSLLDKLLYMLFFKRAKLQ